MSIQSPNLGSLPLPVLQQAVMGQVPGVMPYEALSQIQKLVEKTKLMQAMQNQQALSQPTPPTVAQQVMGEAQGIMGALPQGGAPQGFAEGGSITPYARYTGFGNMTPEEYMLRKIREKGMEAYQPRRANHLQIPTPQDDASSAEWRAAEAAFQEQQKEDTTASQEMADYVRAALGKLATEKHKEPSKGTSKIQTKGTGIRGALPKVPPTPAVGVAQALTSATSTTPGSNLGIMGLDERVSKQREMAKNAMGEYDQAMGPIAKYYDERMKAAEGKQMDTTSMLARMAQGMSGKKRFGDMLAGAAGAGVDFQEKFEAEKQGAIEAAMSAKMNLEKARLAYQSGRLEEAAGFIKAYEDDKLKAQQLAQAAKHQEESLKFNREELAARERMAREQNATQRSIASMRTAGGAGTPEQYRALQALDRIEDNVRARVESSFKENPALLRELRKQKITKEELINQEIRKEFAKHPDLVSVAGVKLDARTGSDEPVHELFDAKKYPPLKP